MNSGKTREIKIILPEELFSLFPSQKTIKHLTQAKKELLFALRSIIDAKIEALDKLGEKKVEKKKIKID
jgi:hypothetical protein